MVSDYLVSGGGLALSLPLLVMFDLPTVTTWILGLLSIGFAIHGLGVARRQRTRIETDEGGLWFAPPRRHIAWNEITRFGLAYFSTRRDGARGWMELKVASASATCASTPGWIGSTSWCAASGAPRRVPGSTSMPRPVRTSKPSACRLRTWAPAGRNERQRT